MALPRLGAAGALQLRLIDTLGNPLVDLRPYSVVDSAGVSGWWIASDLGEVARGQELGVNHVLGVGGASTTLSALLISTVIDLALDLGTGCAIQVLLMSRFAARVIATDISERALSSARFNTVVNGVTKVEFRRSLPDSNRRSLAAASRKSSAIGSTPKPTDLIECAAGS